MPLLSLPSGVLHLIISTLSNREIKSLCSTCRLLCDVARRRLSRVFLSANPLDIWDDALLFDDPTAESDPYDFDAVIGSDDDKEESNSCPKWLAAICKNNLDKRPVRMDRNKDGWYNAECAAQQDTRPSLWICWQYYQNLLVQQAEVVVRQSDAEALVYGLQHFPARERITITPAAHGWLYQPVYETPMIRAFPKGFNYPIPHGWQTAAEREPTPEAEDWGILLENVKEQWRGARLILPGYGTQLHHLPPALLQRPGFRRLDLPLIVRGMFVALFVARNMGRGAPFATGTYVAP
ncbi:hypothetical protein BO86DRAFT_396817 [Aspergillus japonicus CBS 114.51]|uniref:F-box domain-containing protein n=1 Tax=Aspergillus japonicus CBS 114.51 TaxID=1448312 RepID=A0A8T8X8R6_ASPJA|nr:hypothetical protein BO86DRAFT_396817 [Aspergillus japonicus CBS 114.51]RAH84563.1 hypothetical protein BO86DRAFT_396817 [Aspergillus japonicus CBS 114.51]